VAVDQFLNLDELALELVRLESRHPIAKKELARLQDRAAGFPNEVTAKRANDLSRVVAEMEARTHTLRAQLLPVMRRP
jgi:hypothetical protein